MCTSVCATHLSIETMEAFDTIARSPYVAVALTFVIFILARAIQRRSGMAMLNPILVTIAALVAILCLGGIDYETYNAGGKYIDFWLKPAVVALGVPLYKQISAIRKQLLTILMAEITGCVIGVSSVMLIATWLGGSRDVVLSLAAKSVTTPIAIEVTNNIGGIPALTAAVVVCTGIFGGMAGFGMMRLSHIKSPIAQGLSMGTAAHAVGTAAAIEAGGSRYGAFSSLGLIVNGLLTALLTPLILALMAPLLP